MADGLLRLKHAAGPLGTIVTCVLVVWGLGADLSVPAYMWDRPRWLHKICSHYSSCRLSQVESALISCNASLTQRAKQHFYCIPCLTATGLRVERLSEEAINLITPWEKKLPRITHFIDLICMHFSYVMLLVFMLFFGLSGGKRLDPRYTKLPYRKKIFIGI